MLLDIRPENGTVDEASVRRSIVVAALRSVESAVVLFHIGNNFVSITRIELSTEFHMCSVFPKIEPQFLLRSLQGEFAYVTNR